MVAVIKPNIKDKENTMDLRNNCIEYFAAWNAKDLDKLAEIFADDIYTRDWETSAEGKADSLVANKAIFDTFATCNAEPIELYQDDMNMTVACHINISLDGVPPFEVIDLITFDQDGKIVKLLAFRGN